MPAQWQLFYSGYVFLDYLAEMGIIINIFHTTIIESSRTIILAVWDMYRFLAALTGEVSMQHVLKPKNIQNFAGNFKNDLVWRIGLRSLH